MASQNNYANVSGDWRQDLAGFLTAATESSAPTLKVFLGGGRIYPKTRKSIEAYLD
jgi:hypothetical protein